MGDAVGGYRVAGLLGRGGFGQVVAARDGAGREVAIKLLHPDLAEDPLVLGRFEREIVLLSELSHPNLPRIHDVGRLADGRPYFVMERLRGETLAEALVRGPIAVATLLDVLGPVCAALDAAHAAGVIHRDLKPSNIFLADRVVLLDFGIAKLLDGTGPQLTRSRHVIGSPVSIAPEQIRGEPVDARTDVYGLAVTAYYALSGRPPFLGDWPLVERQHLEREPPSLVEVAGVPAPVAAVIRRALAKRPEDRPPTPGALWGALALAAGESTARVVRCRLDVVLSVAPESLGDDALDEVDAMLPAALDELTRVGFVVESESQLGAVLVAEDRAEARAAVAELARRLNSATGSGPSRPPFATLSIHLDPQPGSP